MDTILVTKEALSSASATTTNSTGKERLRGGDKERDETMNPLSTLSANANRRRGVLGLGSLRRGSHKGIRPRFLIGDCDFRVAATSILGEASRPLTSRLQASCRTVSSRMHFRAAQSSEIRKGTPTLMKYESSNQSSHTTSAIAPR